MMMNQESFTFLCLVAMLGALAVVGVVGDPLDPTFLDIVGPANDTRLSLWARRSGGVGDASAWTAPAYTASWSKDWNVVKDTYGKQNRAIVPDPAGGSGATTVFQVTYPAGSRQPSGGTVIGGSGFYAQPIDVSKATTIKLSYQVFFPGKFNFVKGGKLPGLYGGHTGCSGGNKALDCFSTRFMFRGKGLGEVYLYIDRDLQDPGFCKVKPVTLCNPTFGASMGRGAYTFAPGQWTAMSQTVTLNTFTAAGKPNQDGAIVVYCNGKKVIEFTKVVWTASLNVAFEGIDFETFFGGNDPSWATPTTQRSYFKGFSLIAS